LRTRLGQQLRLQESGYSAWLSPSLRYGDTQGRCFRADSDCRCARSRHDRQFRRAGVNEERRAAGEIRNRFAQDAGGFGSDLAGGESITACETYTVSLDHNMSNSPQLATILVVGAGPVGLTMAAELARHGCRPRIIDRAPKPLPFCRAIGVTPRTLEVWEDMG